MNSEKDPFDIMRDIIQESMTDTMAKLILVYYHYYKINVNLY